MQHATALCLFFFASREEMENISNRNQYAACHHTTLLEQEISKVVLCRC